MPSFDYLATAIHTIAKEKGFWDHEHTEAESEGYKIKVENPSIYPEKLCLIHSEISEALDAQRDGNKDLEEEELADTIIRILDYAAARKMSMDRAVREKMAKNKHRPRLHGRKF